MKIKIRNARLAFPELHEAKAFQGEGDAKFSATFILAPDNLPFILKGDKWVPTAWAEVLGIIATEKWGEKAKGVLAKILSDKSLCYITGPKTDGSGNVYDGFEDSHHITSRGGVKPLLIDADKTVLSAASGKPYGGCFVNASLELWAQDNKFGKRINASPTGVQFVKHGDAFVGGGAAALDEFEDEVTEGAHADDLG